MRVENPPSFIYRLHLLQLEVGRFHCLPHSIKSVGNLNIENIVKYNNPSFSSVRFVFSTTVFRFEKKIRTIIKIFPP